MHDALMQALKYCSTGEMYVLFFRVYTSALKNKYLKLTDRIVVHGLQQR